MDPCSSLSRPPSPSSKQNKVVTQRQYREKEIECFDILRDVIKELTGDELQTRQEILKKAIELLLSLSEARQRTAGIDLHVATNEDPFLIDPAELSGHLWHSTSFVSDSSFYFPYTAQSSGEFNVQSAYVPTRPHDWQWCCSFLMSDANFVVDPNGYEEYYEGGCPYCGFLTSWPIDEI